MDASALICLMGPTAVGKTAIATELVSLIAGDIISVDSAMVYRGMDIGTAKPAPALLARAAHRLIDIRDPADSYSAGAFLRDAQGEITDILSQRRIPVLVGGTSLYFHVLQHGLPPLPKADPMLRKQLSDRLTCEGLSALYHQLQAVDPDATQRIHPQDTQRIQRALEVYLSSGKTLTALQQTTSAVPPSHRLINIAILPPDRDWLRRRIEQRFKQMLQQGLIEEVTRLYQRPDLHLGLPAIKTVGYRQVWTYFQTKLSYAEMQSQAITATWQLAKRQLTWLRRYANLHYLTAGDSDLIKKIAALFRRLF